MRERKESYKNLEKKKTTKNKERKKKNMHAKFERRIIYASCSPLRLCGYLMTLPFIL